MARSKKKRGRPKGPRANKSDFVRQRPNLSAAQIVEAAKAAGFAMTPQLVYRVRSRVRAARSKINRRTARKHTASAFVRSMPLHMSTKEVVEAGKKKGIKVSRTLVYVVRHQQARRDGAPRRKPGEARLAARGVDAEMTFRRLVFELTLPRAREILDDLERGLRELIVG